MLMWNVFIASSPHSHLYGQPFYNGKVTLQEGIAYPETGGVNFLSFYYLSASLIWSDKGVAG
jgi:hypothetical protein